MFLDSCGGLLVHSVSFLLGADFLVLAALILLSGFFASAETAFVSVSKLRLKRLVDQKKPNARLLLAMKSKPQKVLITILIVNNLVNTSAASLAAALAFHFFPQNIGIPIAAGATTFLILVFGDITPKSIALRHAEKTALNAAPALNFFSRVFSPAIVALEAITGFFVRLFGGEFDEQRITEEEVKLAASISAEEGAILKGEKEMIHRVFQLNDIGVSQVMTPREKIVAVQSGLRVSELDASVFREHSRLPVYRRSIDGIVGVFYAKDFLRNRRPGKMDVAVDALMRKPIFVHAGKKIDRVLKEFQEKKMQLAIVVGDKGDTIGLVTIEDIVNQVVGEAREE